MAYSDDQSEATVSILISEMKLCLEADKPLESREMTILISVQPAMTLYETTDTEENEEAV
jgi:hypothetical protein